MNVYAYVALKLMVVNSGVHRPPQGQGRKDQKKEEFLVFFSLFIRSFLGIL